VTAVSSLMDRLLDLSKNSIQYGNSMCPSMIQKLKVIVYFCKVFLLSKFKYFQIDTAKRKIVGPDLEVNKRRRSRLGAYEIHQKGQGADETHQKGPGVRK
jgi:hypothetical protein